MERELISVIIPVYNTKKYLKRCLDSIVAQTYQNLEIIIVDDGSTDGSEKIIKEYAEKDLRIKVIQQENAGQGAARNIALDVATGNYISFIDSDDYIDVDMYFYLIKEIKKNDADLAVCGIIRDHGFYKRKIPCIETTIYQNKDLMKAYLNTPYITSNSWNKLYSKILWTDVRYPTVRAREDLCTLYKVISKSKKAVYVGEYYYIQFVRPNSTERKAFSDDKLVAIQGTQDIIAFINQNYHELLPYCFLKQSDCCIALMGEIISSFRYLKMKKVYAHLLDVLKNDVKENQEHKQWDKHHYDRILRVLRHQRIFRFYRYIVGIKQILLDIVTSIAFAYNEKLMRRKC